MDDGDVMRPINITSNQQSHLNLEDVQRGSDKSVLKAIDKASMNIDSNEVKDIEVSALGNTKTAAGVKTVIPNNSVNATDVSLIT